jgi:hypothetical protein
VKKILALLAVCALGAVGCDDKGKTTGGTKTTATAGGNYERTVTVPATGHATVTDTVHEHKATETKTETKVVTKTVEDNKKPGGGPAVPPPGGDSGKKKDGQ